MAEKRKGKRRRDEVSFVRGPQRPRSRCVPFSICRASARTTSRFRLYLCNVSGIQPGPGSSRETQQNRVLRGRLVAQKCSAQKDQIRRTQRRVLYRSAAAAVTNIYISYIISDARDIQFLVPMCSYLFVLFCRE